MATTVDTLLVRIESDMKDVRRDLRTLQNDTQKTTKRMQSDMQKFGNVAKAVLGSVFVAQIARGSVALTKFASDIEEMQDMSAAVFGSFVGQVRDDLGEFANAVGRSSFELEGLAANVQDTFVPMGFARGEAAKLSVDLVKLATDVGSFKNVATSEVMASFTSALVGNHETLRRYGIVIDQAALQTELYRMGITKNVLAVDQATKIQARLNLIYAGTADAQGNAADTAGSYANLVNAMNAELAEFAVELGQKTLPQMKEFVKTITSMVGGTRELLKAIGFLSDTNDLSLEEARAELDGLTAKISSYSLAMEQTPRLTKLYTAEIKKLAPEVLALRARIAELTPVIEKEADAKEKNTVKTKEMIDAEKAVSKALDAQRFKTQQAKEEMLGMSSAHLKANETMRGLTAITTEQAKELLALIQQEEKHTAQIEAQTLAKEKLKEIEDERAALQTEGQTRLDDLIKKEAMLTAELNGQTEAQLRQLEVALEMGNLEGGQSEKILAQIEANAKLESSVKALKKSEETRNATIQKGVDFVDTFTEAEDTLKETQLGLNAAFAEGKINADEYQMATEKIGLEMKRLDPMFASTEAAARKAGDAVADVLAEAVVKGKLDADALKNIFANLVQQLIAEAIKTFVIRKIMSSVFGGLAGGGSVNSGGFTDGGQFSGLAGGGKIPARAGGGPVLVGERGPELFIPHSGGVIRNNHDTKNLMGGGSPVNVYQTINVDAGVAQTVKTEMMNMLPRFKSETIQAVVDGKRRGKAISKAFA